MFRAAICTLASYSYKIILCKDKRLVGLRCDGGDDFFADFLDERRFFFSIERAPFARSFSSANITAAISACNSIITHKTNARLNTHTLHHNNFNCGLFVRVGIFFVEVVVEKSSVNAVAFERLLKNRIPRKTLKEYIKTIASAEHGLLLPSLLLLGAPHDNDSVAERCLRLTGRHTEECHREAKIDKRRIFLLSATSKPVK